MSRKLTSLDREIVEAQTTLAFLERSLNTLINDDLNDFIQDIKLLKTAIISQKYKIEQFYLIRQANIKNMN